MCAFERSEKGMEFNMEDKKEKLPRTSINCEEWANAKLPKSVQK